MAAVNIDKQFKQRLTVLLNEQLTTHMKALYSYALLANNTLTQLEAVDADMHVYAKESQVIALCLVDITGTSTAPSRAMQTAPSRTTSTECVSARAASNTKSNKSSIVNTLKESDFDNLEFEENINSPTSAVISDATSTQPATAATLTQPTTDTDNTLNKLIDDQERLDARMVNLKKELERASSEPAPKSDIKFQLSDVGEYITNASAAVASLPPPPVIATQLPAVAVPAAPIAQEESEEPVVPIECGMITSAEMMRLIEEENAQQASRTAEQPVVFSTLPPVKRDVPVDEMALNAYPITALTKYTPRQQEEILYRKFLAAKRNVLNTLSAANDITVEELTACFENDTRIDGSDITQEHIQLLINKEADRLLKIFLETD
jgi:hypothetical protein